jgi:hypothetical protein
MIHEKLEHERAILNGLIKHDAPQCMILKQSRKVDRLINKYSKKR